MTGSFTVTTTGYPTPALSENGSLPSGVSFTDNGNGTGKLNGTPGAGTGGVYPITITANNGISPNATQHFTLTVNQAPGITSGNYTTFVEGTPGSFTISTAGFPVPSLSFSPTGSLPASVSFVDNHNGTATISGTPTVSGVFTFWIKATNGVGTGGLQSFTLTVDAAVSISPTSLSFGSVKVGQSAKKTVTLVNSSSSKAVGIGPVTLTVTSGDKTQFSLGPVCPATLPAGGSCGAGVTFAPDAVGTDAATLNIATSAPGSPLKVAITGAGTK